MILTERINRRNISVNFFLDSLIIITFAVEKIHILKGCPMYGNYKMAYSDSDGRFFGSKERIRETKIAPEVC